MKTLLYPKSYLVLWILLMLEVPLIHAQTSAYAIGSPLVQEVFVSPSGNDGAAGTSVAPLRTLTAAWNRIPTSTPLTMGYRIQLLPGTYPEASLPNYMEKKYGTYAFPVIIQAAQGRGTVTLQGDLNVFDCRYLYLMDLQIIPNPSGDVLHFEQIQYGLIRNNFFQSASNGSRAAHETVKINQSQYIYIEDNDISGADDNAIDLVAVQYGHIFRNKIHNAQDWCLYLKGGSAQFTVEANEVYNCGTGGITAGQGTGFEFMVSPWLHYEAYDIKIINNIIHDTEGAGLGVNGGYNILMAHNTAYRTGSRSHVLEVVFGGRSCDGDTAKCNANRAAGGWGYDPSFNFIPNRNIFIYNNLFYNPLGFQSQWQHLAIHGPITPPVGSNVPNPTLTDANLQIKGNVFWNGPSTHPLGIGGSGDGCAASNLTCNEAQLLADNVFNVFEPQLVQASGGDFHPVPVSNVTTYATQSIPDFLGGDAPTTPIIPVGNLSNGVWGDYDGNGRLARSTVGAFGYHPSTGITDETPALFALGMPYPNPVGRIANVELSLPKSQYVRLSIVDALGRTQKMLYVGVMASGVQRIPFAVDGLSNGFYFLRLAQGHSVVHRRLVVSR
ncbi:MAG: right-handed parallel beta-helix repeat-containing protein [Bacteroidetes Order II. Incertae sedis bacterium]|nr:right-handed parallel beta-helix repeat-containing protein [Bacteroidetes Order II. bacterium]